jgi:hypothetical protein
VAAVFRYADDMGLHQFTLKQLLISLIWMCIGFGGIAFSFQPIDVPLHPSYDRLANILPFAKLVAIVTGTVIICLALIPLFTSRRPVPILILMLIGIFSGLLIGSIVANRAQPTYRYGSVTFERRVMAPLISISSAVLGGLLPLVIIVSCESRKLHSDKRRYDVGEQRDRNESDK